MSGPQSTRLVFVSEDYVFDPDAQQFSNGSSVLSLGRQEARLLRMIMSANGETVTRHQIEEMLWPDSTQIDVTRRLNTSVSALRRSLRQHTDLDDPIRTVHGEGYRWALNVLEETRETGKGSKVSRQKLPFTAIAIIIAAVAMIWLATALLGGDSTPYAPKAPTVSKP